jgi:hypothetical protein
MRGHCSSGKQMIVLDWVKGLAGCICDSRYSRYIDDNMEMMLRQRIYQVVAGYEDWNDADSFRSDPGYRFGLRIDPVRQRLRDKPGFLCMRTLYRALKRPFRDMHRIMAWIVFLPTFFR